MIKKLRWKFVAILTSVVAVILLAIFIAVLTTTQSNLERSSMAALQQSLRGDFFREHTPLPEERNEKNGRMEGGKPPVWLPTVVLRVTEDGEVELLPGRISFLEEEQALRLGRLVLEQEEIAGTLREEGIRYLKEMTPNGEIKIALADTSLETNVIRSQAVSSLLIGGGALLVFFGLSILLAGWAVGPVEEAWNRQRQFVADASHELKTPLTVILSNADMLVAGGETTPEKEARRLENIQSEAVRMKHLVEDLLTLARTDHGASQLVLSPVDFSEIVTESLLLLEPAIYDENRVLDDRVKPGIRVMGDGGQLRQVTDILLDNAKKYCPIGGRIQVTLEETGKRTALLSVRNEGEPIPSEELDAIFRRFYRVDKARSHHGGFGLGLSIARGMVIAHGGSIWAESDSLKGNAFFVSLPTI